jgi:hypothetical protein
MNLMELLISFRADASHVKDGADKAKKGIKEVEDASKHADLVTHKLGENLKEFASEAAGAIAGLYAAHHVFEGVMQAGEQAEALGNLSEQLGVSTEDLGLWGDAVNQVDGDIGQFHESVKTLSAGFAQFAETGGGRTAKFFQALGVNMLDAHGKSRAVLDVLPELNEKFQTMSKQESFGIGKKMGMDDGLIRLLQRTPKEFDEIIKRQKEMGQVTDADKESFAKFDDSMKDLNHSTRSLYLSIGSWLFPAMGKFIDLIVDSGAFLKEHEGVLYGIGAAIMVALVPAFIAALPVIGAFLVAFAPIILIVGAVVGALALARMLGTWEEFSNKIMGYVNTFKGWMKDLAEGYSNFENKFSGALGFRGRNIDIAASQQINAADNHPLNGVATGTMSSANSKTVNVTVPKVEVHTQATDAEGTGRAVGTALNDHFAQTISQFDNGVAI